MAYNLYKGEFYIFYPDLPHNGPEPDGDTLKFKPDNPLLLNALKSSGGRGPTYNSRGMVNVRFEGIDALETHFADAHQNTFWAEKARESMLDMAGFGKVTYWEEGSNKVKSVEHNPVRGYVLAKNLDPYGRVVAFVFSGDHSFIDGSQVWFGTDLLNKSLNARLLKDGLVYPAFYSTLPVDLKNGLADISLRAKDENIGLWLSDTANEKRWATVPDLQAAELLAIWPKLFRRLTSYFGAGFSGLAQFESWMRADKINRDDRLLLPTGELGNMHDILDINMASNQIRLNTRPEDVVIVPDDVDITAMQNEPLEPFFGPVRIIAALANPMAKGDVGESVTLINIGPEAIDLAQWAVSDKSGGRINLAGTIASGKTLDVPLSAKVRLANTGDTIVLFDPQNNIVHQVSYDARAGKKEGWTIVF